MKGRIMRNEPINRISLPIIGKIKVGIKDEKGLPKSIDYFVSTGKYAGLFNQAYGDKPQTIQIVFVYDEPEKSCREEYQYRDDAGKLVAYGDGWIVTLTVTFIIPLVRGVGGVWQFTTKGTASTIPNIRDTFDAILEEKKFVKGIIFDMNVQFAVSQKPGDRSRYPVVTIVPNESEGNLFKVKEAFKPVQLLE